MAENKTNGVEELVQAYNQAVSSGIAAMDAGMAQSTAAVKLMTDAVQTERTEYGKVWEEAAGQARKRGETLFALFPTIFQGMGSIPATGIPSVNPESKESVGKIVESELAFYQSWTQAWMQYFTGVEERRSAASKTLMQSSAKAMESGQKVVKDAVKYNGALIDWSLETVNAKKS